MIAGAPEAMLFGMQDEEAVQWANEWLEGVANGSRKMSQRKLTSVVNQGGGIASVKRVAQAKGVHLLLLKDENGVETIVASTEPFTAIC